VAQPTAKKRTEKSPEAKKRAERRAKAKGGGAAGFQVVLEASGAPETEDSGLFGLFGGGAGGEDTAPAAGAEEGPAEEGPGFFDGWFGGDENPGTGDEVDDGEGSWYDVFDEDDPEYGTEEQRKEMYEEVDKKRAKDQLAPLFNHRGAAAAGAGGAKDRKAARKAAGARKKAGAVGALTGVVAPPDPDDEAIGLPTVAEDS